MFCFYQYPGALLWQNKNFVAKQKAISIQDNSFSYWKMRLETSVFIISQKKNPSKHVQGAKFKEVCYKKFEKNACINGLIENIHDVIYSISLTRTLCSKWYSD